MKTLGCLPWFDPFAAADEVDQHAVHRAALAESHVARFDITRCGPAPVLTVGGGPWRGGRGGSSGSRSFNELVAGH